MNGAAPRGAALSGEASGAVLPVLMYHSIGPVPPGSRRRAIHVAERAFALQMWMLRQLGWQGVGIGEAMPWLVGGMPLPPKVCVITFDDGFANTVSTALPVLLEHGHRATCYVVASRIGQDNGWSREVLGVTSPLADAHALRRWTEAGMELGAHTLTHPYLTRLSDGALNEEVAGGRRRLQDLFDLPIDQFCYPYGDHDARVVEAVGAAGFVGATTTVRGRARPLCDPLRIPRVHVLNQHGPIQFLAKLLSRWGDRA